MTNAEQVAAVSRILEALSRNVDALEQTGEGIPAVQKNALRMRGTLRALEIQFSDLAAVHETGP